MSLEVWVPPNAGHGYVMGPGGLWKCLAKKVLSYSCTCLAWFD